jgi:hypothetical protein
MFCYLEAEGYVDGPSKLSGNGVSEPSYKRYEKYGPRGIWYMIGVCSSHRESAVQMVLNGQCVTGGLTFISWNKTYHVSPCTIFIKQEIYPLCNQTGKGSELRLFSQDDIKIKSVH